MTPAINELDRAGVDYTVHQYEHGDDRPGEHRDFGIEAAEQLGLDPEQVFKTLLVAAGDRLVVAIVPVSAMVSLKAVAAATGAKRATMADPSDAERVTGYVRGGISPFGQRRRLPTVLDETAEAFDVIFVSGGRRGLDIGVAPADLVRLLGATLADIAS